MRISIKACKKSDTYQKIQYIRITTATIKSHSDINRSNNNPCKEDQIKRECEKIQLQSDHNLSFVSYQY